jgi:hypothetical protein
MTHHTTASVGVRAGALLAGAALITLFASPVGAVDSGRINPARTVDAAKVNGNACRPLTAQKAAVHTAAAKREATVARLISSLQDRRDPWSMNAGQISALQSASAGITALDAQIQSTCYATVADFRSDATKLFTNYRVYWLRVPQTHGIEAADWLGEARTRLGAVATKLASHVGTNAQAKTDLAAMNQALAAADAKLGTPPKPSADIAKLPTLAPAADMTADVAAMEAARSDLKATRAQLAEARADALKVIADLRV